MEFLNVMLKVWMKYWNLFLQGLGMTLFMGLLTVLIILPVKIYSAFIQRAYRDVPSDSLCIHSDFIGNSLHAVVRGIIAALVIDSHNAF